MLIDNLSPRTIKKLRYITALLGLVLIAAFIVLDYFHIWSITGPGGGITGLSLFDIFILRIIGYIFFFIAAISALRWPIIGGAIIFAIGGYIFFTFITGIGKYLGDSVPLIGFRYVVALTIIAFILLIWGLAIILIGLRERSIATAASQAPDAPPSVTP